MATDILGVAFKADTRDLKKGANDLDKVAASGTKAGKAADKLQKEFKKTGREAGTTTKKVSNLSRGFRSAATNAAVFEGPLGGISGRLGAMATILTTVNPLMIGFGVASSAMSIGLISAAKEADKMNLLNKKQEALLRSTGHAAGFAAHELDAMATALARGTLASVEGVKEAQNVLLTFKNLADGSFKTTLTLAQDMSSVLGTDIKGAAMQLGKALNDPATGLTALTRAGVTFDPIAKETIKNLVAIGEAEKARQMMFDELNSQFSDTGAAESLTTLSGAIDAAAQSWQEFQLAVDKKSGIGKYMTKIASSYAWAFEILAKKIDPSGVERLIELGEKLNQVNDNASKIAANPHTDRRRKAIEDEIREISRELSQKKRDEITADKLSAEKKANDKKSTLDQIRLGESTKTRKLEDKLVLNQDFGGHADWLRKQADEEVRIHDEMSDEKDRRDKESADKRIAMENFVLSSTASIAGDLSALAASKGEEGFLAYKRLAQAQIAISTAMAAMRAYSEGGPYAGPILAGLITGIGAAQAAQVEQQQYTGARAMGGQVSGGQSYVVGEQGREVITMGSQGGFVTPNHKLGGGENVTVVNQIGNSVSGNTRAEVMAMMPSIIAATSKAARSARR
tara:strand:+ start:51 stop:1931 length:1881 start_codon:yes stop_codon:yes gene_type:complete